MHQYIKEGIKSVSKLQYIFSGPRKAMNINKSEKRSRIARAGDVCRKTVWELKEKRCLREN